MPLDAEKLKKAKAVLQKMGQGINPVDGTPIEGGSFLHDARIIRCLFFVSEVLDQAIDSKSQTSNRNQVFAITAAEKEQVQLPLGTISISQFAKCVNEVLSPSSKTLSGLELNKHLKTLGILTDVLEQNGKKRTAITAAAAKYGIISEKREYNGTEYEQVVYDETGKLFLLENLERILKDDVTLLES